MILGLLTSKTHSPDPSFYKYENKNKNNLDRFCAPVARVSNSKHLDGILRALTAHCQIADCPTGAGCMFGTSCLAIVKKKQKTEKRCESAHKALRSGSALCLVVFGFLCAPPNHHQLLGPIPAGSAFQCRTWRCGLTLMSCCLWSPYPLISPSITILHLLRL